MSQRQLTVRNLIQSLVGNLKLHSSSECTLPSTIPP